MESEPKRTAETKHDRSTLVPGIMKRKEVCCWFLVHTRQWLVVVIIDAGSMPKAVWASGTNGSIFIIVPVVVIIVVVSVPISV